MHLSTFARTRFAACTAVLILVPGVAVLAADTPTAWRPVPPRIVLEGNFARLQLVVEPLNDGRPSDRGEDLTAAATYRSTDPRVVGVDAAGRVLALGNGAAEIVVTHGGTSRPVPVEVSGVVESPRVRFDEDILPILGKSGCNSGPCHAAQYGQGGFRLSVFGFAPDEDHFQMTRDRQGRRVNPLDPARSLLLLKPTLQVPHGGGRRMREDDVDFAVLAAWVAGGMPGPAAQPAKVESLSIYPPARVCRPDTTQQFRVTARWSDGKERDVTHWCRFDSLDAGLVEVSPTGLATIVGRGQAGVMARFEGQAAVAPLMSPFRERVALAGWTEVNAVDRFAAAKFRELGLEPAERCDDATFVRRVFLDTIGTLPSPETTAEFLASTDPDKRAKLIDRLLGLTGDPRQDIYGNAYAAYWSLKWSDLLRSTSRDLGEQGMWALHNWLMESFRENKPFDRFVRELIVAKGSIYAGGPANFYRVAKNPPDQAETVAQLFLGVRLQCAKCHHHPFEKYGQDDYYGFAAFFARVGSKTSQEFGIFGREQVILVKADGDVRHPRSNRVMPPTTLDGRPAPETPDRRTALADWITAKNNEYFARNLVNRYFAYLFGRGLVEPIDDLRNTNPAVNEPLLAYLAEKFAADGYDAKKLLRELLNSRLYQSSSTPHPANPTDDRFFSRYYVKRIGAEALLDALDQAAGTRTKFDKLPEGTRAIELPDAEYNNFFLKTFGKPVRASVCECERVADANLAQALHTLNGEILAAKVSAPQGRVAQLLAAKKSEAEIGKALFLATLCREPTSTEQAACAKFLKSCPNPRDGWEDILWALLNSKEFLFVR